MTTDAAAVPNSRKIMKLRSVFPPPPSTTADVPLAEQDVTRGTTKTTIDTRQLPLKKPPQPEQRTPNRPMVVAPHSPKVISSPPPTAKRSPPRLEPSAKDSRKKERAFPATIRKPSTVDPPAVTSRTNTYNSDPLPSPNPQRDQPTSISTGVAAVPKSPTPLGLNTGMSVKERVQMFQGAPSDVPAQGRRTDLAISPKGILTKPTVAEPLEPREQRPEPIDSPDEKLVQTPVRPNRSESSSSTTHSPLSTPTRSAAASSSLQFHHTPPPRVLNPYDPAFSLQSQGSIKSHPSSVLDTSDEISRTLTPPRPTLSSDISMSSTATPIQANQNLLSLASSQSLLQSQSSEEILLLSASSAPAALHRPMGRPAPDQSSYVVQVAGAEWDTRVWKYRVLVQKRELLQPTTTTTASSSSSSFTQAFCFRSVPDFFWLEQALAAEFHGALLVPDLRIALQVSQAAMAAETPVDHALLQDWLSDVLNGYRGAGEWELPDNSSPLLLHQSTSMESFLYKKVLQEPNLSSPPAAVDDKENAANMMQCGQDDQGCEAPNSLVESFSALFPLDFCGVVLPNKEARRSDALATAKDLQMQDSIAEVSSVLSGADGRMPSVHSELIRAQRDLAVNYKASSLRCLDCLQTAVNHEERVGLAWRRLAETLGSLFRYESDVDLSDAVRVKYMPFRKLEADVVVDERLHRLVQAKAARGVPALREVQTMLAAYIADFNAVDPAIQAYKRGRVTDFSDSNSLTGEDSDSKLRWDDFRDWTRYNAHREDSSIPPPPVKPAESRKRSAANEKLLRQNLMALFQAAPLRRCRMAWKYYSTEARACSELKTAAAALRSELDVVKPSSVSKLRKRHSRDEKADHSIELDLLQRMVHLGHAQKVQYDSGTESTNSASIGNEQVEVDNDDLSEERSKAIKRDRALELARQRIGQWNAALATSIMEAVGVEDPNVRVEETTQALRIVRKYAIGLRDRLNRCVEAMDALQEVVEKDKLKDCRETFRESFSVVLSGIIKDTGTDISQRFPPASKSTLRVTSIDTNDSFGWMSTSVSKPGRLGDMSTQYARTRDAQIEWLISSLSDLFKEYYQRIEVIEGFVYMECVGIQLEKNFSAKRSKALAAFEKKADLTAALAIATRKRMKGVVDEVQAKLRTVDASHTTVKETKEAHLESKAVKSALHSLAVRRLVRARELSTERATTIVEIWSKEEELNAQQEVTILAKALSQLEQVVVDRIPC